MKGVTIFDTRDRALTVDLADLLHLLGRKAAESRWEVCHVEATTGAGARTLEALSDAGEFVEGTELIDLAKTTDQVYEGTFRGYLPRESTPWVVIRAVDSTAYDVESKDAGILELIRRTFRNVRSLPE